MEDKTEGGGGDSQLARGWKRVLREETVEGNEEMDCIVQLLGCLMSVRLLPATLSLKDSV